MKKLGLILRESFQGDLDKNFKVNDNAFIVSFSSVAASDLSNLRASLKQCGARLFMVRNALVKRSLNKIKLKEAVDFIDGPTAFIWNIDDPVVISKTVMKFVKEHKGLSFTGGFLDRKIVDRCELEKLASLPSKEILQAMTINAIKYPISGLLNVINESIRQVLNILKNISQKKQGG